MELVTPSVFDHVILQAKKKRDETNLVSQEVLDECISVISTALKDRALVNPLKIRAVITVQPENGHVLKHPELRRYSKGFGYDDYLVLAVPDFDYKRSYFESILPQLAERFASVGWIVEIGGTWPQEKSELRILHPMLYEKPEYTAWNRFCFRWLSDPPSIF